MKLNQNVSSIRMDSSPSIINSAPFLSYAQSLVDNQLLSAEQVHIIQVEQNINNANLRDTLIRSGFMSEAVYLNWACKMADMEVKTLGLSGIQNVAQATYDDLTSDQIETLNTHGACAYSKEEKTIFVAIKDPLDNATKALIAKALTYYRIVFVGALEKNILSIIKWQRGREHYRSHDQSRFCPAPSKQNVNELDIVSVLEDAVSKGASDIHFCPQHPALSVRYRIDGDLQEMTLAHIGCWSTLLSRLKIMSKLKIEEKNFPQFGRFTYYIHGRYIDFRASSHPTADGENFVIRILDRMQSLRELHELGFEDADIVLLKQQLALPHGMIIMTGPTGSGKTTTLYSMLSYLQTNQRNIMTLEDPIEYKMPCIRQTQINEAIGLTYAQGIRSILRQDPDVILVGEIRDEETARMALRASMTGHLVLTTLHANSCLSAPRRLLELGVNPDLLSGNINAIISQRLVKKPQGSSSVKFEETRKPVVEILSMSERLDDLFMQNASTQALRNCAESEGFIPMSEKVKAQIQAGSILVKDVEALVAL